MQIRKGGKLMLKRFCDRCEAEIPIDRTIGLETGEFMLSQPGIKAFDLCVVCQIELVKWFMEKKNNKVI